MARLRFWLAGVSLVFVMLVAVSIWVNSPAYAAPPEGGVSLMQTIAKWKYPGAKMPHGANMGDGGNPLIRSIKCQTVLTTPDPIEKVFDFYKQKLSNKAANGGAAPENTAQSVSTLEDSAGRPVKIYVIVVHRADTSTTLVISRAADEKETHIAWSHYILAETIAPHE
jgi:hypothetical protein